MLQIKNTLGGGKPEGLYAWIKKEWIPPIIAENPSMSISASNNGTSDYKYIQISSADFDYTQIEGDYKEFFNGFKKSSSSYYFTVSGGYLYLNKDSLISLQITAFDKSKGIFTMASVYSSISATVSYSGSKTVKDGAVGDTIDYIVSDKETAYPDGGEKDGYWYEKVGEGAKFTTGTVTPSSGNWLRVEHGLGVTPDIITVMAESSNTSILAYALHDIKRPDYALIGNLSGSTKVVTMYRDNTSYDKSSSYGCCNETFFSLPFYQYNASWGTSLVYRWVCISLKE